jgi:hypothetical protein
MFEHFLRVDDYYDGIREGVALPGHARTISVPLDGSPVTLTKGTSSLGRWAETPTVSFSPEANSDAPPLRLIRSALHCCPVKSGGRSSSNSHVPAKQR